MKTKIYQMSYEYGYNDGSSNLLNLNGAIRNNPNEIVDKTTRIQLVRYDSAADLSANCNLANHTSNSKSPFDGSSSEEYNESNTNFDCLINDGVNVDTIANDSRTDSDDEQVMCQNYIQSELDNNTSASGVMNYNSLISYKLNQNRSSSNGAYMTDKNIRYSNDYVDYTNKFNFVLIAPTSPAVKVTEESLTYLNQGQNYELKLTSNDSKLTQSMHQAASNYQSSGNNVDLSELEDIKPTLIDCNISNNRENLNEKQRESSEDVGSTVGPVYLSILRICFWDRKLQENEYEEIRKWEKEYQNTRMLEIDSSSSFGTLDIRISDQYINAAEIIWNGRTGANIFFRCNCTSTAFAPHKHGGEKGIHLRFQIDTFEINPAILVGRNINLNSNYSPSNNSVSSASSLSSSSSSNAGNATPTNTNTANASSPSLKRNNKTENDYQTDLTNYQNYYQQQSRQQNQFSLQAITNTSSDLNSNNYLHLCGSYCRIQLFRLKGAQRKLKTDRSKIDKLNPPDIRKRYHLSNKVTPLYNCQYDPIFSFKPFALCASLNSNIYTMNMNNCGMHNGSMMPSNSSYGNLRDAESISSQVPSTDAYYDQCMHNSVVVNECMRSSSNGLSNSSPANAAYYNNSSVVYGGANNYPIQPIMVLPTQQQDCQSSAHLTELGGNAGHSHIQAQLHCSQLEMSTTPSSMSSESGDPHFYLENNQHMSGSQNGLVKYAPLKEIYQSDGSQSQLNSSIMNELVLNQGAILSTDGQSMIYNNNYHRLKRSSSNNYLQYNSSSLPPNGAAMYGANANNCGQAFSSSPSSEYNTLFSLRNKIQKTNHLNDPFQTNTLMNNSAYGSVGGSSSSSSSPPVSPISPTTYMKQMKHVNGSIDTSLPKNALSNLANAAFGNQAQPCNPTYMHSNSASLNRSQSLVPSTDSVSHMTPSLASPNGYQSNGYTNQASKSPATASLTSSELLQNYPNIYVQDWLIKNRFPHLIELFKNYTSSDILRLSKDDIISLCGLSDGIRLYNLAHNIQNRLTVFVKFENQLYFSAVFQADWPRKLFIEKVFTLYSNFVTSLSNEDKDNDAGLSSAADGNASYEKADDSKCKKENEIINKKANLAENGMSDGTNFYFDGKDSSKKSLVDMSAAIREEMFQKHKILLESFKNAGNEIEIFLNVKGIIVKATDDVLNNLSDRAKFQIEFEISSSPPTPSTAQPYMSAGSYSPNSSTRSSNHQTANYESCNPSSNSADKRALTSTASLPSNLDKLASLKDASRSNKTIFKIVMVQLD